MAIKLDLNTAIKEDKKKTEEAKATPPAEKKSVSKKKPISNVAKSPEAKKRKRAPGRPKGVPTVARSLRINTDINDRLIIKQEQTGRSFNDLVNLALDAYLK